MVHDHRHPGENQHTANRSRFGAAPPPFGARPRPAACAWRQAWSIRVRHPGPLQATRHLIASDLRYNDRDRLARQALPVAAMVGLEWPELATWRDDIERRDARRTSPWGRSSPAVTAPQLNDLQASLPPDMKDLSAVQPVETICRSAPKVGRNDACPCGSGKKYKKCCMKDEA